MKPDIHPDYRFVVFRDISCDFEFLTRSSIEPRYFKDKTTIDGTEYPVVIIDVSSASHPFYTGTQKILDAEGRVEAYYRKYGFQKPPELAEDEEGADEGAAASESPAADEGAAAE